MIPGLTVSAGLLASTGSSAGGNPVTLANKIVSQTNTDGTAATSSFTFRTDRSVKNQANTSILTWLDAAASASDYQIRATLVSGDTPSGSSLSTWLTLSSNRQWTLTDPAGAAGSKTCKLTIEIRDAASPNTLRASATFTMKADSQSSAGTYDWADISGNGSLSSISASNADVTMLGSGTLNFTYDLDTLGMSAQIFKNGVSLGQVASTTVVNGDLIHMRVTGTGMASFESRVGTITVSGFASDTIYAEVDRI